MREPLLAPQRKKQWKYHYRIVSLVCFFFSALFLFWIATPHHDHRLHESPLGSASGRPPGAEGFEANSLPYGPLPKRQNGARQGAPTDDESAVGWFPIAHANADGFVPKELRGTISADESPTSSMRGMPNQKRNYRPVYGKSGEERVDESPTSGVHDSVVKFDRIGNEIKEPENDVSPDHHFESESQINQDSRNGASGRRQSSDQENVNQNTIRDVSNEGTGNNIAGMNSNSHDGGDVKDGQNGGMTEDNAGDTGMGVPQRSDGMPGIDGSNTGRNSNSQSGDMTDVQDGGISEENGGDTGMGPPQTGESRPGDGSSGSPGGGGMPGNGDSADAGNGRVEGISEESGGDSQNENGMPGNGESDSNGNNQEMNGNAEDNGDVGLGKGDGMPEEESEGNSDMASAQNDDGASENEGPGGPQKESQALGNVQKEVAGNTNAQNDGTDTGNSQAKDGKVVANQPKNVVEEHLSSKTTKELSPPDPAPPVPRSSGAGRGRPAGAQRARAQLPAPAQRLQRHAGPQQHVARRQTAPKEVAQGQTTKYGVWGRPKVQGMKHANEKSKKVQDRKDGIDRSQEGQPEQSPEHAVRDRNSDADWEQNGPHQPTFICKGINVKDSCIWLPQGKRSFLRARKQCRAEGGDLASIHNHDMQHAAKKLVEQSGENVAYIGVERVGASVNWKFTDDSKFDYEHKGLRDTRCMDKNEKVAGVNLEHGGKWCGVGEGNQKLRFLCSRHSHNGCADFGGKKVGKMCFWIPMTPSSSEVIKPIKKTFAGAIRHCEATKGRLSSIHSRSEDKMVMDMVQNLREEAYIGLRREPGKADWDWIDQKEMDYDNAGLSSGCMTEKDTVVVVKYMGVHGGKWCGAGKGSQERAFVCSKSLHLKRNKFASVSRDGGLQSSQAQGKVWGIGRQDGGEMNGQMKPEME